MRMGCAAQHWVLVVMDQCTRRILGFGVHRGIVDGVVLCRMFNRATRGHTAPSFKPLRDKAIGPLIVTGAIVGWLSGCHVRDC